MQPAVSNNECTRSHKIVEKLNAAAILQRVYVAVLEDLFALRKKGWEAEQLDTHFVNQRHSADNASEKMNIGWFYQMRAVMRELNEVGDFVSKTHPFEFLDLGCAPGGFSSYVLHKNPRCTGSGISLPSSLGGHAMHLNQRELSAKRFSMIEQDLLLYDLGRDVPGPRERSGASQLHPVPPAFTARFSLVILDGHALRTYKPAPAIAMGGHNEADKGYRDILLISQFILALSAVRQGGTIVAKLTHVECFPSAHLIYLLDVISDSLILHKPRTIHANRGTFYAIATGIGCGPLASEKERYVDGLRKLWRELKFGGADGRGRSMSLNDLDFVIPADDILGVYVHRLVELGKGVWATQAEALRSWFQRKGIL
ncbi:hypothetical protein BD413DRAFT_613153 [Trametes elegans]|nr:hypothetical protein BD413DRAFT_613153 [Trametes elegans]